MESLQSLLRKRKIKFDALERRIRFEIELLCYINFQFISPSCFPHIVNLACKAVISAITDPKYVDDTVEGYEDYEPGVFSRDCIAIVRSIVNAVSDIIFYFIVTKNIQIRNSNLKKQRFSEYVQLYFQQDYQLLRDVLTRWSSTLLMISRGLLLNEVNSTHILHTFTD